MFCPTCQQEINTRFCAKCGTAAVLSAPIQSERRAVYQDGMSAREGRSSFNAESLRVAGGQGAYSGGRIANFNHAANPVSRQPAIGVREARFHAATAPSSLGFRADPPQKDRTRVSTFFVTFGGLAVLALIVFVFYMVIENINKPDPVVPVTPGLLELEGGNNYPSVDDGTVPPFDQTGFFMSAIDDADIIGDTAPFSVTLSSGHYVSGIDFPVGSYKVYAVDGYGTFVSNHHGGRGYVNQLLGTGEGVADTYLEEVGEIFFPKGTMVSFSGLTVRMDSAAADVKNQEKRAGNPVGEEITLTEGSYVGGVDFEPGVYDITAVQGSGTAMSSNPVAGLSSAMAVSPQGSHQIVIAHNVILARNTALTVGEGLTVQLTPSTGSDY